MHEFFVKFKRRTIPYGIQIGDLDAPKRYREYLDEFYLREMNIAAGGVGCAVWDAAVILGHWIRANPSVFFNSTSHELGAGIGLPGLMAARYAKKSIISDYVPILIENLDYQIMQNSRSYQDFIRSKSDEEIEQDKLNAGKPFSVEDEEKETHDERRERFAYNVGRSAKAVTLDWLNFRNMSEESVKELKADIIIGSEVSYIQNQETLESLLTIIDTTLSQDGVFYLVQSTDRGTSHIFAKIMQEKYNFIFDLHDVPETLLDIYATGQLLERYQYYTFRRPSSKHPVMKYCETQVAHLVEPETEVKQTQEQAEVKTDVDVEQSA